MHGVRPLGADHFRALAADAGDSFERKRARAGGGDAGPRELVLRADGLADPLGERIVRHRADSGLRPAALRCAECPRHAATEAARANATADGGKRDRVPGELVLNAGGDADALTDD